MKVFSGKYNYWSLVLTLIGLLIFWGIFLFFALNADTIYNAILDNDYRYITLFGFFFILLSSAFFVYKAFVFLMRQRFNLFITEKQLILRNIFSGNQLHFDIEKVIGFSTSDIHTKISHYHVIIIYTEDNKTYEFPQFVLTNFKELKKTFAIAGIKYLGHEPYFSTWYGSKKPKYL